MLNRILLILATFLWAQAAAAAPAEVKELKVTILSTSLVDRVGTGEAVGEWGFAALVEADGRAILYDTGEKTDTVLKNAKALGIDLSRVEEVVISHHHGDHTGGLIALRRELMKTNPRALSRAFSPPETARLRCKRVSAFKVSPADRRAIPPMGMAAN